MADIQMPGYQAFWTDIYNKLKSEYQQLIGQFPDADAQLKQLLKIIHDIEEMARYTPASVGESEQWSTIVSTVEENRQNFCKVLNGKNLVNVLYGTYTVALHELNAALKASTPAGQFNTSKSAATQEDGFKGVRRRK
jgi:predicted O-linked N-acetylglucosamine transferase (SPINDLY family)